MLCPVHPFPLRGTSPQGETRSMERENRESYISRTISAFSPFGGWRHHLARWEACHWIRGSRGSPMNPVPLPPPQFGGAAKGKRLNGQARRLTSPHLEVLCRTSTGDYKAPLCCELLMKGLLFRALLSHRSAREGGAVRHQRGESHRRWLIDVMLIMSYDTESKSRNADFISIAR